MTATTPTSTAATPKISREDPKVPSIPSAPLAPAGIGSLPTTVSSAVKDDFTAKLSVGSPTAVAPLPKKVITVGDATVALFDLAVIERAGGAERSRLIREMGEAARKDGFFAVKAEDITPLVEAVNTQMRLYFAQSLADKMKDWHDNNGQSGFAPEGMETAAGQTVADRKQTYNIPPIHSKWPNNMPEFERVLKAYHAALSEYAVQVLTYFAEYLGEPLEDPRLSVRSVLNLLRLAYYPALKPGENPQQIGAAEHKDLNGVTLLPAADIPGLQMRVKAPTPENPSHSYMKDVIVPKGYIIVNLGEQFEYKTAKKLEATPHQVCVPAEFQNRPRHASIFFVSFSDAFSLKPLEGCASEMTAGMSEAERREYLAQFPDVTAQENLLARLIEMGALKDPSEALVKSLREKGLIKFPPEAIKQRYPALFQTAQV